MSTRRKVAAKATRAVRQGLPHDEAFAHEARAFCDLFPAVYLRFHRHDGKGRELPSASRAVLQHLSVSGPLRIGELARHLDRAQSVVSEIVGHLERDSLVERFRDTRDRRVALVWLTEQGLALLAHDRDVLAVAAVSQAMDRMRGDDREALLRGMRALLRADGDSDGPTRHPGSTPLRSRRRRSIYDVPTHAKRRKDPK